MGNAIRKIEEFVDNSETLKNAYFWSPPSHASSRRSMEDRYSIPEFTFDFGKDSYTCELTVKCSCKNVYVSKVITKNGKTTNITPIKNILKKMLIEFEKTIINPAI